MRSGREPSRTGEAALRKEGRFCCPRAGPERRRIGLQPVGNHGSEAKEWEAVAWRARGRAGPGPGRAVILAPRGPGGAGRCGADRGRGAAPAPGGPLQGGALPGGSAERRPRKTRGISVVESDILVTARLREGPPPTFSELKAIAEQLAAPHARQGSGASGRTREAATPPSTWKAPNRRAAGGSPRPAISRGRRLRARRGVRPAALLRPARRMARLVRWTEQAVLRAAGPSSPLEGKAVFDGQARRGRAQGAAGRRPPRGAAQPCATGAGGQPLRRGGMDPKASRTDHDRGTGGERHGDGEAPRAGRVGRGGNAHLVRGRGGGDA